jgi:hypothetical protein
VPWTKRDVIGQAFSEIGLASYTFDLLPEQWEGALRRLDAMIAQWENKGIRLAWPLPVSFANSSIDAVTGAPDTALEALYLNLAVRLAPGYGKTPSPDTKSLASTAYKTLLAQAHSRCRCRSTIWQFRPVRAINTGAAQCSRS